MSDEEIDAYPPYNFSWFIPDKVAAMGYPRCKENLQFLVNEGIQHLITLSPEKQPPITDFPELIWSQVEVDEFNAPTMKNIRDFIEICEKSHLKGETIGIHCRQGRGRSGVMLACYLMVFQDLAPERAMINVRMKRPGSCETEEQEEAVVQFHECLHGPTILDNKGTLDERLGKNTDVEMETVT